ncbi:RHS repeat-associated core domain-containing protein [Hymenobacter sp.]|jgi:RHS repeat-associated protein|uniref:RHS repeat-associated core domain-containing protein n=1 Tax=Hymenobacter sp. TaxID=1898978 RepID=UPI002ED86CF9
MHSLLTKPKIPSASTRGINPVSLDAYLRWTLTNKQGQLVRAGIAPVPVATDNLWHQLDLALDIDLSSEEARTGTLRVQELNDASNPVFFDLLTISHPQDQVLVSQENHYYPLGMAMSGVGVNTIPAVKISKQQFNGGSELQDELLGTEAGVYSTFYRTYDPALGRFTGVDPLADVTPDWTPYQFAMGNPISANDPTGALSQADINLLYNLLDVVNNSDNNITGILLSFGGGGGGGDFLSSVADGSASHIGYRNGQFGYYSSFGGGGEKSTRIDVLQEVIVGMKFVPVSYFVQGIIDHREQLGQSIGVVFNAYVGYKEIIAGLALEVVPEPTLVTKVVGTYSLLDGITRVYSAPVRLYGIWGGNKDAANTPSNLLGAVGFGIDAAANGQFNPGSKTQVTMELAGNFVNATRTLIDGSASVISHVAGLYYGAYQTSKKLAK